MSNATSNAWPVLVAKAARKVQESQSQLQAALDKTRAICSTRDRLLALMQEYAEGHRSQEQCHHRAADNLNYRQFLGQLQQLLDRALQELEHAQGEVELARRTHLHWEQEHMKMSRLAQHMQQTVAHAALKAEQKRYDELAVLQHRLRLTR